MQHKSEKIENNKILLLNSLFMSNFVVIVRQKYNSFFVMQILINTFMHLSVILPDYSI